MFGAKKSASSMEQKFSASETVALFKDLDTKGIGEISTFEFIINLKASQVLSAKLGMPEKLRKEASIRDNYQLIFGAFECERTKSITVSLNETNFRTLC
jgi:hypothetical protein